jgi:hypothetical protein
MQSFASRFLFNAIKTADPKSKIPVPKIPNPNKYEKMSDASGGKIQLDSAMPIKSNQEMNKTNLKLKKQNSWDLVFKSDDANTIYDIEAYYGVFQSDKTSAFISSCERNCNYGRGVGDLVADTRKQRCAARLSGQSRFFTRFTSWLSPKKKAGKKTSKIKSISKNNTKSKKHFKRKSKKSKVTKSNTLKK